MLYKNRKNTKTPLSKNTYPETILFFSTMEVLQFQSEILHIRGKKVSDPQAEYLYIDGGIKNGRKVPLLLSQIHQLINREAIICLP